MFATALANLAATHSAVIVLLTCRDIRNFEYNHSPARATGAHFTSMVGATILTPEMLADTNAALRPCMEFALGDETTSGISKRRAENSAARTTLWLRSYLDARHGRGVEGVKPVIGNSSDLEVTAGTPIMPAAGDREGTKAASSTAGGDGESGASAVSVSEDSEARAPFVKRARLTQEGDELKLAGASCIGGGAEESSGRRDTSAAVHQQSELEGTEQKVVLGNSTNGITSVNVKGGSCSGARVEGRLQEGELLEGGWVVGTVCGHAVQHRGRSVAQMITDYDSELAGALKHVCRSLAVSSLQQIQTPTRNRPFASLSLSFHVSESIRSVSSLECQLSSIAA